jgi:hypothetical protein
MSDAKAVTATNQLRIDTEEIAPMRRRADRYDAVTSLLGMGLSLFFDFPFERPVRCAPQKRSRPPYRTGSFFKKEYT